MQGTEAAAPGMTWFIFAPMTVAMGDPQNERIKTAPLALRRQLVAGILLAAVGGYMVALYKSNPVAPVKSGFALAEAASVDVTGRLE